MRKIFVYILLCVLLLSLGSCYTATESTPRIEAKEVSKIVKSEEELVMENNFIRRGCHTWLPGKAFACVDDVLSPVLRPEKESASEVDNLNGKMFIYEGFREENIYGDKALVTLIFRCDSSVYTYRTGKSLEEIAQIDYLPLIPSLVDIDEVAMARSLFEGKVLYILTNQWYDAENELFTGRKFIPVTIEKVNAGNKILPLSLFFVDADGVCGHVYMSVKSSAYTQIQTFDKLFSYNDPRQKYPDISDAVWNAITSARLLQGMTKEECKLSIGLPSEVKKIPTYSGLKEQWIYNTGAYLFFSDGILEDFRQ